MRAGEDQPIVLVDPHDGFDQRLQGPGRFDAQGRDLHHFGAHVPQTTPQFGGLAPGPGHHHAATMQRAAFEPVQRPALGHDASYDDHGRTGDAVLLGGVGEGGQGRLHAPLAGSGAPLDHGRGRGGILALLHQSTADLADALGAHEDHQGSRRPRQFGGIHGAPGLGRVLMPRDHGEPGAVVAMGERDSRVVQHRGDR